MYSGYSNGLYRVTNTVTFLYEGWNCMRETGTGYTNAYTWGLDLSGTRQGAGGVGGLLSCSSSSSSSKQTFMYAYDGNGNVMGLVSTANGTYTAQYEYGPFGETLKADGPQATNNNFRFSTKPFDRETGLIMYQLRPYSPALGRWWSRDRIGERGGINVYGFVGNDPVSKYDLLGMLIGHDVVSGRAIYTCRCGWLDKNHAVEASWQPWDIIAKLEKRESVIPVDTRHLRGTPLESGVMARYRVMDFGNSTDERLQLAWAIWFSSQQIFESHQGSSIIGNMLVGSAFSVEDLPSDYIAFLVAAEAYYGSGFGLTWDQVLKDCDALDKKGSEWVWHYGKHVEENHSVQPVLWEPEYLQSCWPCKNKKNPIPSWFGRYDAGKARGMFNLIGFDEF